MTIPATPGYMPKRALPEDRHVYDFQTGERREIPLLRSWERIAEDLGNLSTLNLETAIDEAYGFYDADPRVHGPDDMLAFRDALQRALSLMLIAHGK